MTLKCDAGVVLLEEIILYHSQGLKGENNNPRRWAALTETMEKPEKPLPLRYWSGRYYLPSHEAKC